MGLITKNEAARILGRSERAIDEWIAQGVLKTHLVKQTRYIDGDTVDALKDTEADITHAMQERQKTLDAIQAETATLRQRENFNIWSVREAVMTFVAALDVLNDREKRVLVDVMEGQSYESIGEDFCLTRERVRQIFYRALRLVSASMKSYRRMLNETIELRRLRDEVKEKDRELQQLRKMMYVPEPDSEMCKLLSTELAEMGLSVRTINCLKSADICTVGELMQSKKLMANLEQLLSELDEQQMDGTVSITGGEPSLCKHAGLVVDIIKRHNRFLNINTNFHHTIDSTLDPDWVNISRHRIDQDPYTRIQGLDFGMLDEYKKQHPNTKARIQCVLHPYGLRTVDDILRFIEVYASSLLIDDFSFRRLINTKDGEAERDLFTEFKEYLFNHAIFVEQTIQDYYIYEIYELGGNMITISFSDMALLKNFESREPDNLLREIIIHPDGLVSGSWYRDKKILMR